MDGWIDGWMDVVNGLPLIPPAWSLRSPHAKTEFHKMSGNTHNNSPSERVQFVRCSCSKISTLEAPLSILSLSLAAC